MAQQLDPPSVLDAPRFHDYEGSVIRSRLVERVALLVDRPGLSICDVGGASGVLLAELSRRCAFPFRGVILEVLGDYAGRLADPGIEFIQASILDNDLPAESFDIVTARHVLHHLVAGNTADTVTLQFRAISEMLRLVRSGGCVVFEEEVNRVPLFSRIVYHLSRLANHYRLRLRFFETGRVVVSFMSPAEIAAAVAAGARSYPLEVLEVSYQSRVMQWRWRLTLLMARVGNLLYVIRKRCPSHG